MLLEQPIEVPQEKPVDSTAIPEGEYVVIVTEFKERTVSGPRLSGRVFDIILQVVEGSEHGATLTAFCPLFAEQQNQRSWGQKTLSKIAWACGLAGKQITDTSQVENIPFVVRVATKEEQYIDKNTGEEKTAIRNEIKDYVDQKSWLASKREGKPSQSNSTGYQRQAKSQPAAEQPAGYAAGKRQRKVAASKPKIEFIADPNDPRVADYPFEIEVGETQLWIDENETIWELQSSDLKNFARYYFENENDEDPYEEKKPVDDFEVIKP